MATEDNKQAPQKGTVYLAEVEDSLNDVLVVCLRHGDRVFRGVLIDALKSGPIGVTPPITAPVNPATQSDEEKSMTSALESSVPKATEGHTTLAYRQTYHQNLPLPPPRPFLMSPKRNCSSDPKQRMSTRTRPFRLRPRNILCSRCKHSLKGIPSPMKLVKPMKRKTDNDFTANKKKKSDCIETHTICSEKQVIKISYAAPKKEKKDIIVNLPISPSVKTSKQNKLERAKTVLKKAKSKANEKTTKLKPNNKQNICGVNKLAKTKNIGKVVKRNGLIKDNCKKSTKKEIVSTKLTGKNSISDETSKKPIENRTLTTAPKKMNGNGSTNFKLNGKIIAHNVNVYDFDSDDSESDVEEIEIDSDKSDGKTPSRVKVNVHKKNITRVVLGDGRIMCIGDVIWGKIIGFPWWPGRVVRMNVSRQDNGTVVNQEALIKWFAANTISYINVEKLFPFLQYYKSRFDKKRRGVYKEAVKMANTEALALTPEVRALNTMFETSALQP
ncbi:PWWP domain-containing protein 2A-like [Antedon mediterranea]|uniref:PWWP domain-containing protein 2A-like n=1 Tax=Antedon mediterranea TaxID=105859 RepID=UPI003AF5BBE0